MFRLVLRRLLLAIPLILVVSGITFLLASFIPGDAARTILGNNSTPEQYEALRTEMGLDQPLWKRYVNWLANAAQGDLGRSVFTGADVSTELNGRLLVTLSLTVGVAIFCVTVGVLLGVIGATKRGRIGSFVDAVALLGLALPSFWVGLVLIAIFAVGLGWLPATGYVPFAHNPSMWAASLVLPVVALGLHGTTKIAKQSREAILDTLDRPFVRSLRASGLGSTSILYKHVLRNSGLPIVNLLGYTLVTALSGAVFVETVFVLPGLGSMAQQATLSHDLMVLQGIALYFTLITVIINLLTDLASGWLNPKVRAV